MRRVLEEELQRCNFGCVPIRTESHDRGNGRSGHGRAAGIYASADVRRSGRRSNFFPSRFDQHPFSNKFQAPAKRQFIICRRLTNIWNHEHGSIGSIAPDEILTR